MTINNSGCACGTMERHGFTGSVGQGPEATTVCPACGTAKLDRGQAGGVEVKLIRARKVDLSIAGHRLRYAPKRSGYQNWSQEKRRMT